ncbi:MAG: hypothetical protein KDI17_00525 [Halioglobus sp.]|nr:hypothetical protein [Halioglobus sp.]
MKTFVRCIAVLYFAGCAGGAQALVTSYDNLSDWTVALGNAAVVSDPFDNDIGQGGAITFDSGVLSTVWGLFLFDNSVSLGSFHMAVSPEGVYATPYNDWFFPHPVFAFGFDFSEVAPGLASVVIDDGSGPDSFELYAVGTGNASSAGSANPASVAPGPSVYLLGYSGFAGFVSDSGSFSAVRFYNQAPGTLDAYNLDNLVFATRVPTPGTLALFSLGIAGLLWSTKRSP